VLLVGLSTFGLTVWLYLSAPKGFFPQEDIGQVSVNVDTPQDMGYESRLAVTVQLEEKLRADPNVRDVVSKVDHDTTAFTLTIKDRAERPALPEVLKRLRGETAFLPGIKVFFSPVQNLRIGGRGSKSTFQYTLQSVSPGELDACADKLVAAMKQSDVFVGLNTDAQKGGLQALLTVDRGKAALLGVDMSTVRITLYGAYGGQQVSTIYAPEDSYPVIMEMGLESRRDENGAGAALRAQLERRTGAADGVCHGHPHARNDGHKPSGTAAGGHGVVRSRVRQILVGRGPGYRRGQAANRFA
jgi:HAE1 family hydrophobic/amphiphilic exporter-1